MIRLIIKIQNHRHVTPEYYPENGIAYVNHYPYAMYNNFLLPGRTTLYLSTHELYGSPNPVTPLLNNLQSDSFTRQ